VVKPKFVIQPRILTAEKPLLISQLASTQDDSLNQPQVSPAAKPIDTTGSQSNKATEDSDIDNNLSKLILTSPFKIVPTLYRFMCTYFVSYDLL
jgi:hypothetical protein